MIVPNPNKLRIVCYPDRVLKQSCAPVTEFNGDLGSLVEQMLELMHEGRGIGLAGPQVGVLSRLFVCNVTGEPDDNLVFVNPRFLELTGAAEADEGCLSLPGVGVTMRRAEQAIIEAQNVHGEPFQMTGQDLLARVWQHESDHLDGRLIVDHMSTADEIANRRALKQLEEQCAPARPRRR